MAKKNKTHSGVKKRVKITASGKVKYYRSGGAHIKSKKSSKKKRDIRRPRMVHKSKKSKIKRLLGK
ncbi:MAG: 50S ribosomal protein L35 [Elusimicrobiota bacterium]